MATEPGCRARSSRNDVTADWTIKTGSQIKHDYNNFMGQDINQVLNGVPYFVYGDPGSVKVNFGKVNFTGILCIELFLNLGGKGPC